VFDEQVFPFAELHHNAGRRLRNDILLLPTDTPSSTSTIGDAQTHDYIPLHIVPVVANRDQVHHDDAVPDDSASDSDQSDENFAENEQEMNPEEQEQEPAPPTPPRCNAGGRSQMYSPSSSDRPLPDSSGPANDWPAVPERDVAPSPLPPRASASCAPASPLPLHAEPSQEARAPASPPATTPPTGDTALYQPAPAPPAPAAASIAAAGSSAAPAPVA
jgi:hypothetical protein